MQPLLTTDLLAEMPTLRRYARVLANDARRADALVRETLLHARHNWHRAPHGGPHMIWLLSILRTVYFRDRDGRGRVLLRHVPGSVPAQAADAQDAADALAAPAGRLLAHVCALPLDDREVLVLVAVERMAYSDIAALLDVPVSTVLFRLGRARDAIRNASSRSLAAQRTSH